MFPISPNYCDVKRKAGALFKNLQQLNAGRLQEKATTRLRICGLHINTHDSKNWSGGCNLQG
jgi:hypothetical protein